jgi:hypothetical protein
MNQQQLFNYLSNEHGVDLLENELQEVCRIVNESQWIEFSEEKPPESDFYFVKGKRGSKACIFYYAETEEWELGNLAHNFFSNSEIYWLKEYE